VVNEVADNLRAARGVRHFGMELEAEKFLRAVFDGGVVRVFRGGDGFEAGGKPGELVAVGIPNLQLCRQGNEERGGRVLHLQATLAVFALAPRLDLAAQILGQQLDAVADPEHRDTEVEDRAVRLGRLWGINAGGAAGEQEPAGPEGGNFGCRGVIPEDHAIDVALANAPGDDLCVLRTEIQNDDLLGHLEEWEGF